MKLPSDHRVEALFDRLRRHARHRKPGDTVDTLATLAELEQALLAALRRARSGSLPLDATGAPATSVAGAAPIGWSTGAGSLVVPDEHGAPDTVPATSVELAVLRGLPDDLDDRWVERRRADPLEADVQAAVEHLVEAVNHLGALQTRLALIARKASPLSRSETGGAGICAACERDVSGAAEDRLRSGYCDACRKAWDRAGRPDRAAFARERRQGRAS